MIPQQLEQKFNSIQPFLVQLKKHIADTLAGFADENNFPFSGRIKTPDSIGEKIEMGRYERFSQIEDLVAFTLIIPSANFEGRVVEFCRSKFQVIEIRNKLSARKSPELFRFDSTRVIARLHRRPDVEQNVPSIFDWPFEIQVRTAFEHAWAVATHDLVYKGASIDWKRLRLAAQLKATSETLDAAIASFDHLAQAISESPWEQVKERSDVSYFVTSLFKENRLPPSLKPASISRFSENFCTLVTKIRPNLQVREAIEMVSEQLEKTASTPISLSLYQLFLGLLFENGSLKGVQKIPCHVTPELITIYPRTRAISCIFDYER
jgi:ppGpp synthetase/RelA/SpoT-type nucleotidyltranferase